ncbi:MAG TPA: porin PorA family protein [Trebonia sp.]|jgi:hypothetical protein
MKRPTAGLVRTGLLLAGLAALCTAGAVVLGWRMTGPATARPLGEHETVTLTAAGASYFSPVRLTEVTGAALTETETITAVTGAGYPAVAVWDVHQAVYDATSHVQLEPESRTVAFDRSTAELVNCCDGNVNGDGLVWQDGIAGYAFPVGTRKQTYAVFDTVLGKSAPLAYSGTGTVGGITAYQFTEDVTAARAGFSALSATDPQSYSVHRVYWVDPVTGSLLKVSENEDLALAKPAGGTRTLFHADLAATPDTVQRLVGQDIRERNQIGLMSNGRLALFVLASGFALLAACLLAARVLAARLPATGPTRRRRLPGPADGQ